MVQVARLAPKMLEDSTSLVADFFRSQHQPDGGFCDRTGASDLYYTVFGLSGLMALEQPLPLETLAHYVQSFGDGSGQPSQALASNDPTSPPSLAASFTNPSSLAGASKPGEPLDLVHLSCLARCWAALPPSIRRQCPVEAMASRIETFRTPDGGYNIAAGSKLGMLYGCFVATGAYQDLGLPVPSPEAMLDFIATLRDPKGGYHNGKDIPVSLIPPTAAAVALLRHFGNRDVDGAVAEWMLGCFHEQGGFRASPVLPAPDLLSTATALHALASMHVPLGPWRELCLDFVDTLWTNRGGFYGYWEDDAIDCEYTYYGLLSLGHLAV